MRLIWAKRRVRRGRRFTFRVLVLSINKREPTARAAGDDDFNLADFVVFYMTAGGVQPERPLSFSVPSLATAPPPKETALHESLQEHWQQPGGGSVFDRPIDPNLDTGHYDDGHAFGWTPAGQPDVWKDLTTFANGQLDQVIERIEAHLAVDVDGDGDQGSGTRIDTTVGPPVITENP